MSTGHHNKSQSIPLSIRFHKIERAKMYEKLCAKVDLGEGGSPGLVVMGGDSCSKGCEFESLHRILDGHFHIYLL